MPQTIQISVSADFTIPAGPLTHEDKLALVASFLTWIGEREEDEDLLAAIEFKKLTNTKPRWKTRFVIWTDTNPSISQMETLVHKIKNQTNQAIIESRRIDYPEEDREWTKEL